MFSARRTAVRSICRVLSKMISSFLSLKGTPDSQPVLLSLYNGIWHLSVWFSSVQAGLHLKCKLNKLGGGLARFSKPDSCFCDT